MFKDASISFNSPFGTPQVVTASAASSAIYDITGAGSGNAPAMVTGYPNSNTAAGIDIGWGDGMAPPWVVVSSTVAGTGTGTVAIALQCAPDNGSYSPGTWTTLFSTAAAAGTTFTAGQLISFPIPPRPSGVAVPRFYRLNYTVSGTASVSLLTDIVLNPPSPYTVQNYPENYVAP